MLNSCQDYIEEQQKENLDAERVYGVFLGLCIVASIIFLLSVPHLILLSGAFGLLMFILIVLNRRFTINQLNEFAPAPTLFQNLFPFLFKNK